MWLERGTPPTAALCAGERYPLVTLIAVTPTARAAASTASIKPCLSPCRDVPVNLILPVEGGVFGPEGGGVSCWGAVGPLSVTKFWAAAFTALIVSVRSPKASVGCMLPVAMLCRLPMAAWRICADTSGPMPGASGDDGVAAEGAGTLPLAPMIERT